LFLRRQEHVKPLLVETVTASTMADLRAARDACAEADMVELRLDGVSDIDVAGALAGRSRPAIVTCRPTWEGGRFAGSEEERRRILGEAIERGAEYVDIEWTAGFEDLLKKRNGRGCIVSTHEFERIPDDLIERAAAMRSLGAEVVKIAIPAGRLSDALCLRALTRDRATVAIAMGPSGIPTRALAAHFGSRWTYAGDGIAPGQIAAARMVRDLRFRDISSSTAVYGVVGTMTAESKSPGIHNAWFAAAGIDAVMVPMPAPDFDDFLTFADALNVAGAAVTIPFKLDALRRAQQIEADAHRVGAVNTLRRSAGGWDATNTDVAGFLDPLRAHDLRGARVTVLGAGGAARAVVVALVSAGARPTVCARRLEQARELEFLGAGVGEWPPRPRSWDVLVNCTPIGGISSPDDSPLPGGPFDGRLVYDLNYRPAETRLLREACAAGCATLNGWPMLQAQARKQFEWWTNPVCA
jgi:3-dehydroquinate dehydratase/shikimate dehydrogenase